MGNVQGHALPASKPPTSEVETVVNRGLPVSISQVSREEMFQQ